MTQDVQPVTAPRATVTANVIYRILVPFPIAFLLGTLVTDVVFALTGDPAWSRISFRLLCAGSAAGILAAVVAFINFVVLPRAREQRVAWIHFPGIDLAVLLSIVNLTLRIGDPAAAVSRTGLMLSTVVTTILVVAGWTGGELTLRQRSPDAQPRRGFPAGSGSGWADSRAPRHRPG